MTNKTNMSNILELLPYNKGNMLELMWSITILEITLKITPCSFFLYNFGFLLFSHGMLFREVSIVLSKLRGYSSPSAIVNRKP